MPVSTNKKDPGASFYDQVYSKPGTLYQKPWKQSQYLEVWQRITSVLQNNKPQTVFELGCGPGQLAAMLFHYFPELSYRGIDYSAHAIKLARKNAPEGTFEVVDFDRVDSFSGKFDCILSTEVLEHVKDDIGLIRKLPNKSFFIFTVPNKDAKAHQRFFVSQKDVETHYSHLFEKLTVESVPWKNGWIFFIGYGVLAL